MLSTGVRYADQVRVLHRCYPGNANRLRRIPIPMVAFFFQANFLQRNCRQFLAWKPFYLRL